MKITSSWKWLGLAACAVALPIAAERLHAVTAAEDASARERVGESPDRLDGIVERLDRLLERMESRMGSGGPPRGDRRGPPPDGPRAEGGPTERPEWSGPPPWMGREMPPEVREMLERRMSEGRERMEKARGEMRKRMEMAREKFEQLEGRVKALEAEVERLKAGKAGP